MDLPEQAWQRVDWPSVQVDGVTNAGASCTAVWGHLDDGRVVLALMEDGAFVRVVDVPQEAAAQGAVRTVRWGLAPVGSSEVEYRLVGVCGATGLWHCDWGGEIRAASAPPDEVGHQATRLWPVAGDEDVRVVATYGPNQEVRVLGGGFPLRLLPQVNRLEVRGSVDDVMCGSHSGVVAVAGDLRVDGEPATASFGWAWSGFLDHGEEGRYSREWHALPEPSAAVHLTDMGDWPGDVRFAGFQDGHPQFWGIEDFPNEPDDFDCPTGNWTSVLLPDSTQEVRSVVVATPGTSLLVVDEGADPLPLPAGQVQSVAFNEGYWGSPQLHHAVVDGVLYTLATPQSTPHPLQALLRDHFDMP